MNGVPVFTSSAARSADGVNSIRLESTMDWAAAADAMASSKIDATSPCRAFERYPDMSSPGGPEVQPAVVHDRGRFRYAEKSTRNPRPGALVIRERETDREAQLRICFSIHWIVVGCGASGIEWCGYDGDEDRRARQIETPAAGPTWTRRNGRIMTGSIRGEPGLRWRRRVQPDRWA